MNCLLVMPEFDRESDFCGLFPNGIAHIASSLKKVDGLKLTVFNTNLLHSTDSYQKLAELIKKEKIAVVLSGGLKHAAGSMGKIFKVTKATDPAITTVAGGLVVSGDPEAAMDYFQSADYGIIGEGEKTVAELCLALKYGRPVRDVKGIIFRSGAEWKITTPRPNLTPSEIPWPDFDSFGAGSFFESNNRVLDRLLTISTGRGCPNNCTFCFKSQGSSYRPRPLDDFFQELDHWLSKYDFRCLDIPDDMLAANVERLREFIARLRRVYSHAWRVYLKVPHVTDEAVQLLKQAGRVHVYISLESASDIILKNMKLHHTVADMDAALKMLSDAGLSFSGNFLFGAPAETPETIRQTLDWWKAHPQYPISLSPLYVYPGTSLYWQAVAEGRIKDRTQFLTANLPILNLTGLKDEEQAALVTQLRSLNEERRGNTDLQLKGLRSLQADYGTMTRTVGGCCRFCGQELTFPGVSMFAESLACPFCRGISFLPKLRGATEQIGRNLDFLVAKYGRVAFWGIGAAFKQYISPEVVDRAGIFLIDKGAPGTRYGSKTLESPEALTRHKVKFVITVPPDSPVYEVIRKEIKENYGIDAMSDIYKIQDDNFPRFLKG